MIRSLLLAFAVALAAGVPGGGAAAQPSRPSPSPQQEADRHFKTGVARFKEGKFVEALAEFEQANKISPHPLALYNIAGCYRELSRYPEAVRYYRQFLAEGPGKVPPARISDAQTELNGIYGIVARVTVIVEPAEGATLLVDDAELGVLPIDMPLILSPGEHKLVARAAGREEARRDVRVVAGDVQTFALKLAPRTAAPVDSPLGPAGGPRSPGPSVGASSPPPDRRASKRFAVNAAFATNALRLAETDTGTASLGLGVALGAGLELGVDATLVAYAVIPSLRLRIVGDAISLHAIAAAPISFNDGEQMETFVAGAVGLGVRLHLPALPSLALRLESLVSFAGGEHGTTVPTFLGGELWF